MRKQCADIRTHVDAVNRETGSVLEEATSLLDQKSQVETKKHLLEVFKKHFLISEEELAVLTSSKDEVDDDFFRVMSKVKRIHQDSELLLGTENERLGLDILEQSSKQMNAAFQKLYRWIQKEFRSLDLENPQLGKKMRRAIRVLAERPQLFQSCMESFAEDREQILSDSFHAALTGAAADSSGALTSNPIEFQAHDPLRYVGDMLAWTHSATVSEREALEVLFIAEGNELAKGLKTGRDLDPWSRSREDPDEVFDGRQALDNLVSRDIAGVGRLLRQRTEQVVSSHEDAALSYKIANLIAFYKRTFAKLFGSEAGILDLLASLEAFALDQFHRNMQEHVASIQPELANAPVNANAPPYLAEALSTLAVLMKTFEGSMAAAAGDINAFGPVLKAALDPFLSGCENQSAHLTPPRSSIFMLNSLSLVSHTLRPYSKLASSRATAIESRIQSYAVTLAESQHDYLLAHSGLTSLLDAVAELSDEPSKEELSALRLTDVFRPENLMTTSQELDDFLPSALMDAVENMRQLRDAALARRITEQAAEQFCADFAKVERAIEACDEIAMGDEREDERDEEEPPRLRDLFPRTLAEIRVLLS